MTADHAPGERRTDDVRTCYLAAAQATLNALTHPAVSEHWTSPSALAGMTVGELAAHLGLSVLQVGSFLDGPIQGSDLVRASTYYARLVGTTDPRSALNTGVADRSREAARDGAASLQRGVRAALAGLTERLPREPEDRRVAVLHRPGEELLLDEYLRVRCVEMSVHLDDLGRSLRQPFHAPAAAVAVAVGLLLDAARERHGDRAVLLALTRRELDSTQALRVL